MKKLQELIEETRKWRDHHREHKNYIDAAACAIREQALQEARAVVEPDIEKYKEWCRNLIEAGNFS